jgi:hypothetical protein
MPRFRLLQPHWLERGPQRIATYLETGTEISTDEMPAHFRPSLLMAPLDEEAGAMLAEVIAEIRARRHPLAARHRPLAPPARRRRLRSQPPTRGRQEIRGELVMPLTIAEQFVAMASRITEQSRRIEKIEALLQQVSERLPPSVPKPVTPAPPKWADSGGPNTGASYCGPPSAPTGGESWIREHKGALQRAHVHPPTSCKRHLWFRQNGFQSAQIVAIVALEHPDKTFAFIGRRTTPLRQAHLAAGCLAPFRLLLRFAPRLRRAHCFARPLLSRQLAQMIQLQIRLHRPPNFRAGQRAHHKNRPLENLPESGVAKAPPHRIIITADRHVMLAQRIQPERPQGKRPAPSI